MEYNDTDRLLEREITALAIAAVTFSYVCFKITGALIGLVT